MVLRETRSGQGHVLVASPTPSPRARTADSVHTFVLGTRRGQFIAGCLYRFQLRTPGCAPGSGTPSPLGRPQKPALCPGGRSFCALWLRFPPPTPSHELAPRTFYRELWGVGRDGSKCQQARVAQGRSAKGAGTEGGLGETRRWARKRRPHPRWESCRRDGSGAPEGPSPRERLWGHRGVTKNSKP